MRHNMQDFEKPRSVIIVDAAGRAERREGEAARIAAVKDAAALPPECGVNIGPAPARGAVQTFVPREVVRTEAGNFVSRNAGYMGWRGVRQADAFDLMTLASLKSWQGACKRATAKGLRAPAFIPPFTHGQVQVGRDYATLSERCAASGVKCSSLEAQSGGGTGGGREEAMLRDFHRLRVYHRRIGDGLAKEVRKLRPSQHGGPERHAIRVRGLVDAVCLGDMSLSAVLKAHGWAKDGVVVEALRTALCAALDRMQGYDLARPQDMA